jgi:TonB family protein
MRFAATLILPITLAACTTATPYRDAVTTPACDESTATVPKYQEGIGLTAPKLVRRVEPTLRSEVDGTQRSRVVTVEAVITEDGTPLSVCLKSGDTAWGRAVASAVQKWKFQPAMKNQEPVATRVTIAMIQSRDMLSREDGACVSIDPLQPCTLRYEFYRPKASYPGGADQ